MLPAELPTLHTLNKDTELGTTETSGEHSYVPAASNANFPMYAKRPKTMTERPRLTTAPTKSKSSAKAGSGTDAIAGASAAPGAVQDGRKGLEKETR